MHLSLQMASVRTYFSIPVWTYCGVAVRLEHLEFSRVDLIRNWILKQNMTKNRVILLNTDGGYVACTGWFFIHLNHSIKFAGRVSVNVYRHIYHSATTLFRLLFLIALASWCENWQKLVSLRCVWYAAILFKHKYVVFIRMADYRE